MRTCILLILTAAVLGGGFLMYRKNQPVAPRLAAASTPVAPAPLLRSTGGPSVAKVTGGERPWVKVFDKDGRLSYRFRGQDFVPLGGGKLRVTEPEAEFFQYPRPKPGESQRVQRVRIEGTDGEVEVSKNPEPDPQAPRGGMDKDASGPPKRGRLNNVKILLFPDTGKKETLTLVTRNIGFDNESFEILTEGYQEADGTLVAPDEVPIHADGEDYAFHGRGLRVRWNDMLGRLELLEIAHGDHLVVKRPSALSGSMQDGSKPKDKLFKLPPGETTALRDEYGSPIMLAAADNKAAAAAAGGKTRREGKGGDAKAGKAKPQQPPYQATFFDAVRVSEGVKDVSEKQLVAADLLSIAFMGGEPKKPTTRPTTKPASQPGAQPATAPAEAQALAQAPTTKPATQPSEEEQPVIVRWTGRLQVVPLDADVPGTEMPLGLKHGEAVLRLTGTKSPVLVTRDLNKVQCAALDYYTGDGSVMVRNSPAFPEVVLTQLPSVEADPDAPLDAAPVVEEVPPDATVTTGSIIYSGKEQVAVMSGASRALIPMKPQGGRAKALEMMDARWKSGAKMYFTKDRGGQLTMSRARVEGDVDVKHPQLVLKSEAVELEFDPPATTAPAAHAPSADEKSAKDKDKGAKQPNLRRLAAVDGVYCELHEEGGEVRTLQCRQLEIGMAAGPDGKVYPRTVDAAGDVYAVDAGQELEAGIVRLTFLPKARPATQPTTQPEFRQPDTRPSREDGLGASLAELETMTARENVRIVSADGAAATADAMYLVMKDRQPYARLVGKGGGADARVVDPAGNAVSGPVVIFDPKAQVAKVEGKGSLEIAGRDDPFEPQPPVSVTWAQDAELNVVNNAVEVRGPVKVLFTDADGAVNTATARSARIALADRPRPAAAAHAAPGAATRPSTRPATRPTTRRARPADVLASGVKMDLKDKVVRSVTLQDDAVVKSTLSAADGGVLREFELKSAVVRYELADGAPKPVAQPPRGAGAEAAAPKAAAGKAAAAKAAAAKAARPRGRLVVPGPGVMLVRDHQVVEARRKSPSVPPSGIDPGNVRGAAAFQWARSLTYDETTMTAALRGDAVVVYRSDDPTAPPVRLDADDIFAVFADPDARPVKAQPAPPRGGPAAADVSRKPANPPGRKDASPLALKSLTAVGHLTVTRAGATLTAHRVDYDPVSRWLVASGTDRVPATFSQAEGAAAMYAEQVQWNTQTWHVKMKQLRARGSGAPRR